MLEGRSKAGRFGALYEVLPTYKAILSIFKLIAEAYNGVDYNANNAPEDHLANNVRAA